MSRTTKLIFALLIGEMLLVALGLTLWRWEMLAGLADLPPGRQRKLIVGLLAMWFFPVWLTLGLALMVRTMRAARHRWMAEDQRHHTELTMIAAGVLACGTQAWGAAGAILGAPPGREFGLRVVVAFTGVFFAVSANFAAKTSPPDAAPDPGAWARSQLRTSWIGVAAGLAMILGATIVPAKSIMWLILSATLVYVAASLMHARLMRRTAV